MFVHDAEDIGMKYGCVGLDGGLLGVIVLVLYTQVNTGF